LQRDYEGAAEGDSKLLSWSFGWGKGIKCAVVQFHIEPGVATSRAFVFNTRAVILAGKGEINLITEQKTFLLVPTPVDPDLGLATKLRGLTAFY